eukprot:TRINITY_DN114144_c0_g1_i1.p1 TRINITY_DN114144_c0_g1~~TRINITY_DN114144_c0_g1_i1.p1  ORF type:complete len:341 (-),score=77.03 TRINITY_DN114144_c0_g1_i1:61-1035(-)
MASEESAAKKQKTRTAKLTVQLTSGKTLATVEALDSWLVGDVLKGLPLEAGAQVQSLLLGQQVLDAKKTLAECGISEGAVLSAVVVGLPTLHVFKPCSSEELGGSGWKKRGRRGFWTAGGDFNDTPITVPGVQHRPMEDAPEVAKEVAHALQTAFPGLAGVQMVCRNSEGDDGGEVVVIANPGADAKEACFKALAICTEVEEKGATFGPLSDHVQFEEKDWNNFLERGFNRDPPPKPRIAQEEGADAGQGEAQEEGEEEDEDEDVDEDDEDGQGILALTRVMAEKLTQGFEFTFSDRLSVAPMLYGGFASDGSIVGILTSRCWT